VPADILLFAVLGVMIVLMFTSNRKRKQQAQKMQETVVKGAYVMLTSGIYGTVVEADEARVTIETAPGTRMVVNRLAVRQVEGEAPKAVSAAKTPAKAAAKPAVKTATVKKPAAKKPASKTTTK
jgi:preprotein translocase subunit YajC